MFDLQTQPDLVQYVVSAGPHPGGMGGVQAVFRFPNDYGASLIKTPFSYGGDSGKWELAVIQFKGQEYELCYKTPITNDVLGYLTEAEVIDYLRQIMALGAWDYGKSVIINEPHP